MRGPLGEILDKNGDGGDSCNFTCAWSFFSEHDQGDGNGYVFDKDSVPRRHPTQEPWNNPKNFSRDQAVPLVAILPQAGAKAFFKRFWAFLPNTERDWPGSKKLPWPSWHHKNSHDEQNRIDPRNFYSNGDAFGRPLPLEFKWFDWADPVTPDFFGLMVLKSKTYWLYWTLPLGWLWCLNSIVSFWLSKKTDFKQLFITSTFYKLDKLFYKYHPGGLERVSHKYFVEDRDLGEIHEAFVGYCNRHYKKI